MTTIETEKLAAPGLSVFHLSAVGLSTLIVMACSSTPSTSAPPPEEQLVEAEPGPVMDLAEIEHDAPEDATFGQLLSQYQAADYEPPRDVSAVVDAAALVISGEVEDLVEGRKEMLGDGSDPNYYVRHLNIVIRAADVMKTGEKDDLQRVAVEVPWPQNLSTDALLRALPRGERALVMGGDDGEIPVAVADGETLVLQVAPFGLVIESADGRALLPLEHDLEFHEATRQRERLSFAMLQDEVARAADDE